jgi:hypothetical protein
MSEMVLSGKGVSELEAARGELERWRSDPSRSGRIPAKVWELAVGAARTQGVHAVSRALRLSYSDLKAHMHGGKQPHAATTGGGISFVEVTTAPAAEGSACTIELSKAGGTRLCISLDSAAAVDWCRLKEAFLGA